MKVYKQNTEPLEFLLSIYKFETDKIENISTGLRYTAVLLKNGNIGVCANLGHKIDTDKNIYSNYDLKKLSHRIVLNAYLNSLLNYSNNYKNIKMIFGSTFGKDDHRILKIIQNDGGTKDFLKFGNKCILQKDK